MTKVVEDELQNVILTNEQTLVIFSKQFKGSCRSCGKYGHNAAEHPDKKIFQVFLEEIKVDFRASASSVACRATEQTFARRVLAKVMKSQAMDLQESEDKEPSHALAILDGRQTCLIY